jgi:hypothetical protein
MARQKLNLDLEALFPGDTLKIGGTVINIRPLGVLQLSLISKKLKGFLQILSEDGVTWENYNQTENIIKIASILLEQFPEILAEASNIDDEDLKELPLEVIVQVLDKVIEVNLKSKSTLEKNFKSLTEKLGITAKAESLKNPKLK